ncbi:hypothetical protein D9M69_687380 [compost metagenome]
MPNVTDNDLRLVIAINPSLDKCLGQFAAQGTIGSCASIDMKKGGHVKLPLNLRRNYLNGCNKLATTIEGEAIDINFRCVK